MTLNKKKVLIIGGTSGIGLEVAHGFNVDHDVVIIGRDIQKIADDYLLSESIKISCDIGDEKQRQQLLALVKLYIVREYLKQKFKTKKVMKRNIEKLNLVGLISLKK
jgi:short-subunit dehydrogenase involved in D-alanine esterification of teichoic acids